MAPAFKIASPCSAKWEQMEGDDRVRYCSRCNLQVFNLTAMSGREIAELRDSVAERFCGRLYLRSDGTALTRDCPVGFRLVMKKLSRVAGAALSIAGALNLATPVLAQSKSDLTPAQIQKERNSGSISVTLTDRTGAVIADASIVLANRAGKQTLEGVTDSSGQFEFKDVAPGSYFLTTTYAGFQTKQLAINVRQRDHVELKLELDVASTEMGAIVEAFGVQTEPLTESVPDRLELPSSNTRLPKSK